MTHNLGAREPDDASQRVKDMWLFSKNPQTQFEQLLKPHLVHLYRLAYHYTGSREDAEDLVQDLLLKLYPRLDEMLRIDQLSPWLKRILYNQFVDGFRKRQRSPVDLAAADNLFDYYHSDGPGPAQQANSELTRERLNRALRQLNDEQRLVILLHDAEGYSLQEIGQMTGVADGTLKSRLNRGRKKLRQMEPDLQS